EVGCVVVRIGAATGLAEVGGGVVAGRERCWPAAFIAMVRRGSRTAITHKVNDGCVNRIEWCGSIIAWTIASEKGRAQDERNFARGRARHIESAGGISRRQRRAVATTRSLLNEEILSRPKRA